MAKSKGLPVEAQAVAALILGQLGHKLVAKLPGARAISGTTDGLWCPGPLHRLCSGLGHLPLAHSLGLHHRDRAGDRVVLQPLVFHVIMGILLVYFCWLGYQAAGRLCN